MSISDDLKAYREHAANRVMTYVGDSVGEMIAMRAQLIADGRSEDAKRITNRVVIGETKGLPGNLIVSLALEEEWKWDSILEDTDGR